MKKYFVTIMLSGLFMVGACAQDLKTADVPANIKSLCLKKFPETANAKVSWEKEIFMFVTNSFMELDQEFLKTQADGMYLKMNTSRGDIYLQLAVR